MEIDKLKAHLATGQPLAEKVRNVDPDPIELMALCALLHGFYTSIENILCLISRCFKEETGAGKASEKWHQQLLASLNTPSPNRPALLSEDLYFSLLEYLRFRHVFRHAYQQEIRWSRMKNLTLNVHQILERFILELNDFKNAVQPQA
jgi:hypothetical protein